MQQSGSVTLSIAMVTSIMNLTTWCLASYSIAWSVLESKKDVIVRGINTFSYVKSLLLLFFYPNNNFVLIFSQTLLYLAGEIPISFSCTTTCKLYTERPQLTINMLSILNLIVYYKP